MIKITQELVQSLFNYRNGFLYWKIHKNNHKAKIDDKAGSLNKSNGYYKVRIDNKSYYIHRLIFLYHKGYLPKYIDHIDNDSLNNKIENLRSVTQSQNLMNQKLRKNSSSKYKGVNWYKRDKIWVARIIINGKLKYLGQFKNETDAALAYNTAAIKYFGEYANLNNVGDKID